MDMQMIRGVAGKLFNQCVRNSDFEHSLTVDDLVSAGIIGYLEAEKRLKSEKSDNPSFFLYQNVRGRMIDLLRKQAVVRIPQQPYGRLKELKAMKKELEQQVGEATPAMLASRLGWKKSEIEILLAAEPKVFSGDSIKNGEESGGSFFESFLSTKSLAPQLDATLKEEIASLIKHCLEQLKTPKQRLILTARYLEEMRLKELAVLFNCTEQAVHYQERISLQQMRSCLEDNGWQWEKDEENV